MSKLLQFNEEALKVDPQGRPYLGQSGQSDLGPKRTQCRHQ